MLKVEKLNTFYGRAHILFDVEFEIERGEVVALMGRNGAGKSTTLKSLLNIVSPMEGKISFLGQPIIGWPTHRIAQMGIGYVPEERRIFGDLTVLENLEVGRQKPRVGSPTWTVDRLFELFPNLAQMGSRLGSHMSGGEQQMLALARTLVGNPALLLLDEPSEGLAPLIVAQMATAIQSLKQQGLTIIISEQNHHFASAVADRALILEKGQIRYRGSMQEISQNEGIRAAYLSV
ncbi:MAG: ABC transporter ATP-binding protein [Cyanophyceae cyanobacterium]